MSSHFANHNARAALFSVAVYCSSSDEVAQEYWDVAAALGHALAAQQWRLVYGAGNVGLMGAMARAVHAAGGRVYGVIPHALDELEVTYEACDELLRVETMRERKALMEQNADAFVTLPGGFGTLEEIVEILVLKQLHYLDRPIVFVNTRGYWDPLIALFDSMIEQNFARPTNRHLFKVVDTVDEAIAYIANYYPTAQSSDPGSPETIAEEIRTALE